MADPKDAYPSIEFLESQYCSRLMVFPIASVLVSRLGSLGLRAWSPNKCSRDHQHELPEKRPENAGIGHFILTVMPA